MSVKFSCVACGNLMTFSDVEEVADAVCEECFSPELEYEGESDFDFEAEY